VTLSLDCPFSFYGELGKVLHGLTLVSAPVQRGMKFPSHSSLKAVGHFDYGTLI